ncbi:MAG: FHA domain-containing protein [Acidobacteriota bacterium]|nr:FHA domain-containing protein [Acidobacteriota bacterium]
MSFLLQRVAGRSLTLTQIQGQTLRIGRGTNQELRSENPAVALEHAAIESDAAGYFITDKGSITGTYVNRKPVETARLAKGDVIEIGDLRIEVQIAQPAKPLFLRIAAARASATGGGEEDDNAQEAAAPGARVVKAKKLDYAGAYRLHRPWLTKLSITALVLIAALVVVGEVVRPERRAVFMPGGVSSAHARARDRQGRMVAENCDACHAPFRSVQSAKCLDCHPQQPHAEHERNAPDCFACHAEHRGATKLAAIGDTTCIRCHRDLGNHMREARAQLASLRFASGRYGFEHIARITSFGDHAELAYPRDANSLRFNHKLHLNAKGIFNASGRRQVLACNKCHELATVKGKTEPVALQFEQHCQRCHRLTFDARFPNAEVPHGGDPGIVYGFVVATYSGDRDIAGKAPEEVRRILTARRRVSADDRAVLNAEQVIKTKCKQCHELERRGERLAVTPPVLLTSWLDRARFTHGRHRTIGCEQCHAGARASVATGDVLMPRLENCTSCHAANAAASQAPTTCVTCHEYHLRPQRPLLAASLAHAGGGLGGGGRMLQGVLLAVIVILLLVVLVPVGIALFQRLRPERSAAPAPKATRPVTPPAAAPLRADAPTDKVVRPSVPPPDLTPRAAEPVGEATRIEVAPKPAPASEPAGTEMVQWNGMLHCTKGPLEGQRFVIEDEGFYIGRDPVLSKIVVPDSRISKRHVRIVPRDGRVWAIDEGSTNGTFLKGQRITEVQLKRGDTLVLGDDAATFVYQI